jgi:acyl-CoA synthetase (NDP forming)
LVLETPRDPGGSDMRPDSVSASFAMLEPAAAALLAANGIDYVAHEVVSTAAEAVDAAARIGYPVVLKVVSPDIVHKSDVGGVLTGLSDAGGVRRGLDRLVADVRTRMPQAHIEGVLVCRQVSQGAEMIIGAIRDPTFGPTVMLGAGGVFTELFGDVAFRLAPLHPSEALDMLRELRAFQMLTGSRGSLPVDLGALARTAVLLGDLMCADPDIAEVDLNPVRVFPEGCVALDARIILSGASVGDETEAATR